MYGEKATEEALSLASLQYYMERYGSRGKTIDFSDSIQSALNASSIVRNGAQVTVTKDTSQGGTYVVELGATDKTQSITTALTGKSTTLGNNVQLTLDNNNVQVIKNAGSTDTYTVKVNSSEAPDSLDTPQKQADAVAIAETIKEAIIADGNIETGKTVKVTPEVKNGKVQYKVEVVAINSEAGISSAVESLSDNVEVTKVSGTTNTYSIAASSLNDEPVTNTQVAATQAAEIKEAIEQSGSLETGNTVAVTPVWNQSGEVAEYRVEIVDTNSVEGITALVENANLGNNVEVNNVVSNGAGTNLYTVTVDTPFTISDPSSTAATDIATKIEAAIEGNNSANIKPGEEVVVTPVLNNSNGEVEYSVEIRTINKTDVVETAAENALKGILGTNVEVNVTRDTNNKNKYVIRYEDSSNQPATTEEMNTAAQAIKAAIENNNGANIEGRIVKVTPVVTEENGVKKVEYVVEILENTIENQIAVQLSEDGKTATVVADPNDSNKYIVVVEEEKMVEEAQNMGAETYIQNYFNNKGQKAQITQSQDDPNIYYAVVEELDGQKVYTVNMATGEVTLRGKVDEDKVTEVKTANIIFTDVPENEYAESIVTYVSLENIDNLDLLIIEYSFNRVDWIPYTNSGISSTENGTIYVRVRYELSQQVLQDAAAHEISTIDKEAPVISSFKVVQTTSYETTVEVRATDAGSGIKEFYFKKTGDSGDGDKVEIKDATVTADGAVRYTYRNLTAGADYAFTVKVVDNLNHPATRSTGQNTTLAELKEGDIKLTAKYADQSVYGENNQKWTKEDMTVTATINLDADRQKAIEDAGYELRIGTGTDFSKYVSATTGSVTMKENGTVVAIMMNTSTQQVGPAGATMQISKIDKAKPATVAFDNNATVITSSTITVTATATDDLSGIAKYRFYKEGTGWSGEQTSPQCRFDNLQAGTQYTIKIEAIDNAGNTKESSTQTIRTYYVIKYAAGPSNGVSGSGSMNITEGTNPVVAGNGFTAPANYIFDGWKSGSKTYAVGAAIPIADFVNGEITLTAQWKLNSCTAAEVEYAATWDGTSIRTVKDALDHLYTLFN